MLKTYHTVKTCSGSGYQVSVDHEDYAAVHYEFYITEAIWSLASVQTLITRLQSVEPGATIFSGLVGVWEGTQEKTRIYRLVLRAGRFDAKNMHEVLHNEIGRLMADLSASPQHAQQAFMFTETDIRVTMTDGLTRI